VAAESSVAAFDVVITGTDGSSKTYNNNGRSFPVQDLIAVQIPKCSLSAPGSTGQQTVEVVAAVSPTYFALLCSLTDVFQVKNGVSDAELKVSTQTARDVPFPLLTTKSVKLTVGEKVGDYFLYKGTFSISPAQINSTTFDVSGSVGGKTITDAFKRLRGFGLPSPDSGDDGSSGDDGNDGGDHGSGSDGDGSSGSDGDGSDRGSGSGSGKPWEDWQPVRPPTGPPRPCGESEGCDAQVWATETVWHVSTVAIDQHTSVPGAPVPTGNPVVPGEGSWSYSSSASVADTTYAPSASEPSPVSPEIATFTGAAGKNLVRAGGSLVVVAVALVAML
jgi:hypothetical protein